MVKPHTIDSGMSGESVAAAFERIGGRFQTPASEIADKLKTLRGLVFDWDGVFNDGTKGGGGLSGFAEADSMGTNMLRYGLWLQTSKLPVCVLISGENNAAAAEFARREHFDGAYGGMRDKRRAVAHVSDLHGFGAERIACVIDDINDLPMARVCGLRFWVRRPASPLLTAYVADGGLCDYVTGSSGGRHAVREISELMLGLLGGYAEVVASRAAFDARYAEYFKRRQSVATRFYRRADAEITEVSNDTP